LPSQQTSGPIIDPSPFETSFLGHPSSISVHVEAGVGVAGNWRQYYGFIEGHLSTGEGEPLPIPSDRGQSTTAWSLATQYETGPVLHPPSAVSEGCGLRPLSNFTTWGAAPRPISTLDEACIGPYLNANTNPLGAPRKAEGGQSVHLPSQPPPWRYAAKMQEAPSPAPDFVPAEAHLQVSSISVCERSGSPTLSYSPVQPVPTCQQILTQTKGKTSGEAHDRGIVKFKTQLPTRVPQCSLRPDATHDTFGMSNRLCENRRFIIPSLGHAGRAAGNLTGLVVPPNPKRIAFSQDESLHETRDVCLEDDRGAGGSYTETRNFTSTYARLEQSARFASAANATSFQIDSDLTDGQLLARHNSKGRRSSSGVQRTERSHRGRAAGTPLYLRRKQRAPHESVLETLQERCRKQGGDDEAIGHLSAIFEEGVNAKALSRKITEEEIANQVFGPSTEPRQVYWALLGQHIKDGFIRYTCRLCPEAKRYPYKNGKDVVPHIRKCHISIEGETGKFG